MMPLPRAERERNRQRRYELQKIGQRKHCIMLHRLLHIFEDYYPQIFDIIIKIINDKMIGTYPGIKIIIYTPDFKGNLNYEPLEYNHKKRDFVRPNYERCVYVKRVHTLESHALCQAKISSIKFDSYIRKIEKCAVGNCMLLKKVVFDPTIEIEAISHAFSSCYYLEEFTFPKMKVIPNQFLTSSKLKKLIIPEGVISICRFAFRDSKKLKEVVIPSSVKFIDYGAFKNTALTHVKVAKDCNYKNRDTEIYDNYSIQTPGSFEPKVKIEYLEDYKESQIR